MAVDIIKVTKVPPFLDEKLKTAFTLHDLTAAGDADALLAQIAPTVRGMVCGGSTGPVPGSLIRRFPKLEVLSVFGVGYDGVDLAACKENNVIVTNTPDVLTEDVADVALSLALNTAREFVRAHNFMISGAWTKAPMPLATKLGGKTAGILGLGRIGKAIARRLAACGMTIVYHGRNRQAGIDYEYCATPAELARKSDYLIVACQGGAATKNLVDADVLQALGTKGTLINISRGSIVDQPALIAALQSGTIKAAGLDVYAEEPRVPDALLKLQNVVLYPHVGSATTETRKAMADLAFDNLAAHFAGKPVLTRVI